MQKILFTALALAVAYGAAHVPRAEAAEGALVISPAVIDLKGAARDILKESLSVKNQTARVVHAYPFVNNIEKSDGRREEFLDPSRADQSSSLANWIMLGGFELGPGEEKDVAFRVEINTRARPGIYHAEITLAEGASRDEAAGKKAASPKIALNLEVLENIRERLQLTTFAPMRTFFSGFPVSFSVGVENIGNRSVGAEGSIRIFDRSGREVASVPVDIAAIAENERRALAGAWEGPHSSAAPGNASFLAEIGAGLGAMGRYKALLTLRYGSGGDKTLQDTVFFWVAPWESLFAASVIFGGFLGMIFATPFAIMRLGRRCGLALKK